MKYGQAPLGQQMVDSVGILKSTPREERRENFKVLKMLIKEDFFDKYTNFGQKKSSK